MKDSTDGKGRPCGYSATDAIKVRNPFHYIAKAVVEAYHGKPLVLVDVPPCDYRGVFHSMHRAAAAGFDDPVDRQVTIVNYVTAFRKAQPTMGRHFMEALAEIDGGKAVVTDADEVLAELDPKMLDSMVKRYLVDCDDDFDGQLTEAEEDAKRGPSVTTATATATAKKPGKPKASQVASAGEGKSDKPRKAVEPFAKLFDWIARIPTTAPRRMLLSELARYAHHRPFTWVGNSTLAEALGVNPRQIQKQLRELHKAELITIRDYRKSWCKTQRIIFINHIAQAVGIDPGMELPTSQRAFFRDVCRGVSDPQNEPIGCPTGHPIETSVSSIGCPVGAGGDVLQDTRRDKRDFLPFGQRKSLSGHGRGHHRPKAAGGPSRAGEMEDSQSPPTSENELVKQSKQNPSRPPMDWPEKNLPATDPEPVIATKVRRRQVTHIHPTWLGRWKCYMVRVERKGEATTYKPPKVMADGWLEVTPDAQIVPLIDSRNRRISQADFVYQLVTTGIKAPDTSQPVVEMPSRLAAT